MTNLITEDITHPSVKLVEITAQCGGYFEQDPLRDKLTPWCNKYDVPMLGTVAISAALKRSMGELARGNDRELKQTGRGHNAKFTLLQLDLDNADLEESDGKNIGYSEVTVRIEHDADQGNGVDAYRLAITPQNHPARDMIRDRFDHFCGLLSATYDVKPWVTQRVFPALGCFRSPDANGKYVMAVSQRNVNALTELRSILREAEETAGERDRLRLHCRGLTGCESDTLDLLADAMVEETERVMKGIEEKLTGEAGKRALATQMDNATDLQKRLTAMAESLGLAVEDNTTQLEELTNRLAAAQLALELRE